MKGMQGISGSGSMSQNCSMQRMNENSRVKTLSGEQIENKKQESIKQDRMFNQIVGNKLDVKI